MKRKHYKRAAASEPKVAEEQHAHCKEFIMKILEDEACVAFNSPVLEMWTHDEIPGYFDIVKKPMDFRTIRETLDDKKGYKNDKTGLFDFRLYMDDVYLIFDNCFAYNETGTDLYNLAEELRGEFNDHMKEIMKKKDPIPSSSSTPPPRIQSSSSSSYKKDAVSESDDDDARKGANSSEDEFAPNDDDDKDKDSDDSDGEEGGTEPGGGGGRDTDMKDEDVVEELRDARRKLDELRRRKNKSLTVIAKIDEERSGYKSEQERVELRDMIENANWAVVDKVVRILQKYVNKELANATEKDPEFVTLEMNNIEPELLRQVEDVVRPDPRRDEEMAKVNDLEQEIDKARGTLNSLKRAASRAGDRKKSKRRR